MSERWLIDRLTREAPVVAWMTGPLQLSNPPLVPGASVSASELTPPEARSLPVSARELERRRPAWAR